MDQWLAALSPSLPNREQTRVLALGVAAGAVGGFSAGLFDLALVGIGELVVGTAEPALGVPSAWRAALVAIVLSGLAGIVSSYVTSTGRTQGIAESIQAVRSPASSLNARDGLATAAAAALAVGGGQSAGREGPIVQLASSLAAELCLRVQIPPHTARALVAAAAGAGVAASFNSPLGGAFFAMEALLGSFALEAFAPVVVASVVGTVIGQAMLGERLAVALPPFELSSPLELVVYPLLGVACGAMAIAFRRLNAATYRWMDLLPGPPWTRSLAPGLFVAALALLGLPQIMGNGYGYVEVLVRESTAPLGFLVALTLAKLIASSLAVASRSGGGMFAPTLYLGALVGEIVGALAQLVAPWLVPHRGPLATVGMGAVAAAVSHTPITMTVMLFEMTGNYAIILPIMVSIAVAMVLAHAADRNSVYVQVLLDRGIRLDHGREELVLQDLKVRDVMRAHHLPVVGADTTFGELAERFLRERADEVFVVEEGRLVGVIDIQDIKSLLADPAGTTWTSARALAKPVPPLLPSDTIQTTMDRFFRTGAEVLPVVDEGGRLVGVLAEREVVGALNRELLRRDVGMAKVESGPPEDRQRDFVELPEGFAVVVLDAGTGTGKTLRELELPRRLGATVLAVDRWDAELGRHVREPPQSEVVLGPRDRLVLIGPAARLSVLSSVREGSVDSAPVVVPPPVSGDDEPGAAE